MQIMLYYTEVTSKIGLQMKTQGIRILDKKNNVVCVALPDILEEIDKGERFFWSILYLQARGDLGEGESIPIFEEHIRKAEKGLLISWNKLNVLVKNFHEIIDIVLIGCKDLKNLHRYENDQERYEACDIFIEMVDSAFWEVFSKDKQFINRLSLKFKEIIFLDPDFER